MDAKEREELTPESFLRSDAASFTANSGFNESDDGRRFFQYEPTETKQQFVGFWLRFVATFIDGLFLMGVSYLLFNPMRRAFGYPVGYYVFSPVDFIELIFNFLYYILLTWWMGQTLGKMLLGIKVISSGETSARGRQLTLGQVILREIVGKVLSTIVFGLGFIWIAFQEKKQGWHDKIAKTYVVKSK